MRSLHPPSTSFAALALACALALLPAPGVLRAAEMKEIVIDAMRFAPQTIEARVGDVIVWSNHDPFPHTVVADRGEFSSGDIAPGGAWRLSTGHAGTFPYTCGLHPTMHGVLVVR
jgi:plastocyanin